MIQNTIKNDTKMITNTKKNIKSLIETIKNCKNYK